MILKEEKAMKSRKYLSFLTIAVIVAAVFVAGIPTSAAGDKSSSLAATPVKYTLSVDNEDVSIWAYEINGGAYFKLRDIAMALNGTGKQFNVYYEDGSDEIDLVPGEAYAPVGGELSAPSRAGNAKARYTGYSIRTMYDWGNILAYLVDDTHYIKLSDLAAMMKFSSSYGMETRTAVVDTTPEASQSALTGSAFDNIALMSLENSYSLDEDGNIVLSYHNGVTTATAPLKPDTDELYNAGFYISDRKTAIAYGGGDGPVQVLISDDMGSTWNTYNVESAKYCGFTKYIGFLTENDGYLVVSPGVALGNSYNYVFLTSDGGKTWTQIGNPNDVYSRVMTGAGFATKSIGFIGYRVDFEAGPAIYRTADGGYTWEKLGVTVPNEYDYNTPLSPVFFGAYGVYPVEYRADDDETKMFYLTSSDYGMTWTYDENYNLACQWAQAAQSRDGHAQYNLLDSKLQAEAYDGYVSSDWVTGASSPWVDSYTVKATDTGAVITYKWASSTGPDGVSSTALTIVNENSALKIGGMADAPIEAGFTTEALIYKKLPLLDESKVTQYTVVCESDGVSQGFYKVAGNTGSDIKDYFTCGNADVEDEHYSHLVIEGVKYDLGFVGYGAATNAAGGH